MIYDRFGGQPFRQMVGIPMGTNCAPLLADLFLYSYENEFLDKLIKEGKRKLARKFNLSYRYIDDLISFNNKRFKKFISDIYPKELTISETTESTSVASYLDLLFTLNHLPLLFCRTVYFGRSYTMPEVLADQIKHYFVNLNKHMQSMKISLKSEGEAYARRRIFV